MFPIFTLILFTIFAVVIVSIIIIAIDEIKDYRIHKRITYKKRNLKYGVHLCELGFHEQAIIVCNSYIKEIKNDSLEKQLSDELMRVLIKYKFDV